MYGGFVKKILLFVAILPLALLSACSKKSDNNNSNNNNNNTNVGGVSGGVVITPNGTYVMAGTITNINQTCASGGTATVTVSQQSYSSGGPSGAPICTAQVGVGGIFSCPVPGSGVFNLRVQSGTCIVQGNMQALTNGQQAFQVCLGAGCTCSSSNCTVNKVSKDTSVITSAFPGNGDLKVTAASIFLKSSVPSTFELNIEATNGNNLLDSSGKYTGDIVAGGMLTIGSETVD